MSNELSREELRERVAKIMVDYGVDFYEGNLMHRTEQRLQLVKDFQDDILTLIASREQAAELRGRIDETEACLRMCTPDRGVHSNEWLTDFFNIRLAHLQATNPDKGTEE